jgi:hypothetical protein
MIPEKILYTDGHEVTVTDSVFKVKKTMYDLKGITRHGFLIIQPHRLLPMIIALIGVMMIAAGTLRIVPESFLRNLKFESFVISGNAVTLGLGAGLLIVASITLSLMKERYAVRIATAEGEKNVVVSKRKEYVAQIMDALNKAFLNLVSRKRERNEKIVKN